MVDQNRQLEMKELLLKAAAIIDEKNPNISRLSEVLNVSKQHLYKCIDQGWVSPRLSKKIEVLTDGAVTRISLNPHIFG
jgi:hypothetical protein